MRRRSVSRAGAALVALAAVTAAVAVAGCGGRDGAGARRAPELVILGIDGFDWEVVDPLVARGDMPNLERLLARGTRADLLTLVPLEKSPVIWTTIATGHLPEAQGRGFLIESGPDSARAYTAWNRATRAFWNILPDAGRSVAVLGWLETWPAERIAAGAIVSDYVQYDVAEREKSERFRHRTWPEELFAEIEPLLVYPRDVADAELARFVDGEPDASDPDPGIAKGITDLRWIWAGDRTFTRLAREFLRSRPEDVVAVYLRGPDAVCHKFWGARERLAAGDDHRGTRMFGHTVDRYHAATDSLLGEILDGIDLERTTLLLVSDHGFRGGRRGLSGEILSGIWMHRELGTILVAGPGARGEGIRAEGARVVDVLPTVLHLLGLPVGEDMDGEPARWLLSARGGAERAVETVPTWETGEPPDLPSVADSPVDALIRERVEALGYLE